MSSNGSLVSTVLKTIHSLPRNHDSLTFNRYVAPCPRSTYGKVKQRLQARRESKTRLILGTEGSHSNNPVNTKTRNAGFTAQHQRLRNSWPSTEESDSGDHTEVMEVTEDAFDLVGSDPLGTINLCWREPSKRCSLQVPSWPGLEIVFTLVPPRPIGARLGEYRAPTATTGLFARDELHSLGLDANLLDQRLD